MRINFRRIAWKGEEEERDVGNTAELSPEGLYFGVEGFGSGIGGAIDEVVQYRIVVIAECFCYGAERR